MHLYEFLTEHMPLLMMHLYEFVPHCHFELTVLCSTLSFWIWASLSFWTHYLMLNTVILSLWLEFVPHCLFELTVLCSTLSFWAYGLNLCLTVILNSLSYAQHCHFEFVLTVILNSLSYAQHYHFELMAWICASLSFWTHCLMLHTVIFITTFFITAPLIFYYFTSHPTAYSFLVCESFCPTTLLLLLLLLYYHSLLLFYTTAPTLYYSCTLLLLLGAALVYYYFRFVKVFWLLLHYCSTPTLFLYSPLPTEGRRASLR
jgi:hypothetical protein